MRTRIRAKNGKNARVYVQANANACEKRQKRTGSGESERWEAGNPFGKAAKKR
jgi:hypothetical protein